MVGKPLNVFHFCDILPFLIHYMVIQFLILVGLFLVCISNTRTAYLFPPCSICYQSVIAKWGSRRLNVRRDDSRISTMTIMGVGIVRFNHEKSKKHLCRKLSIQRCFFIIIETARLSRRFNNNWHRKPIDGCCDEKL